MPSRRKKKSSAAMHETTAMAAFDIAVRVALAAFFAFSAGGYFTTAFKNLRHTAAGQSGLDLAVNGLSVLSIGIFTFFIACIYAVRLQRVNKFAGPLPTVTAIAGAFLTWGLLFLKQRTDLSMNIRVGADCLILVGNIFAIYSLKHLGRSFSIIPESRALVTTGPYRYVRHPLYLAEAVSTFGVMILFLSPAAVALVVTQYILQIGRMHYEEKVLRQSFPDYAKYSNRTSRLIPGVY